MKALKSAAIFAIMLAVALALAIWTSGSTVSKECEAAPSAETCNFPAA